MINTKKAIGRTDEFPHIASCIVHCFITVLVLVVFEIWMDRHARVVKDKGK